MAKKQTRRSISVSGDTYNAVRDYCDEHGLSASGLVTDLLNQYLIDNADGPPPSTEVKTEEAPEDAPSEPSTEAPKVSRSAAPARLSPPQPAGDVKYPDRRGPGFSPMPKKGSVGAWLVTAQVEISRKRQIDAHTSVETLIQNLIHRRMVNDAQVVKVELITED